MTKENAIVKKEENYSLNKFSDMEELSALVKDHVVKNELYTVIQNKKYIQSDGWAYAGGQMGIYPRMTRIENLSSASEKKWLAEVELVRFSDDKVVGRGFAICSSAESKKKSFDEYAILSQAQTRATGKAFRNLLGWVMKLGNDKKQTFEGTPAEEMSRMGDVPTIQVGDDVSGIQEETQKIQETLAYLGRSTPAGQLRYIKAFCEKKGYKFDGWKLSKKAARELLSGLLKLKLEAK